MTRMLNEPHPFAQDMAQSAPVRPPAAGKVSPTNAEKTHGRASRAGPDDRATKAAASAKETSSTKPWIKSGWAISVYGGTVSTSDTSSIFAGSGEFGDAEVIGVAVSKTIVRLLEHLKLEGELQVNRHLDRYDTWEFVAVPKFTFYDFPWDDTVVTTFSLGSGLSYTDRLLAAEVDTHSRSDVNRLLNFLMLEATFALPEHDQWALDIRYHHRSGVFGTFSDVTEASTVLAIGLRHNF